MMRGCNWSTFSIVIVALNVTAPCSVAISTPATFRNGMNGYAGTIDIQVREDSPDTARAAEPVIIVDRADPLAEAQALLQFSNIFGNNPGQIPFGDQIVSARLFLFQTDPGDPVNAYRMLLSWDDTSSWNSFANGVQPDGIEAVMTADFTIGNSTNGLRVFDVTAAVREWSYNPHQNFGWVFVSTGNDGWRCASSEAAVINQRPMLTVEYGQPPPCQFTLPSSVFVIECEPLTIGAIFSDCSLYRFQWLKDGALIPGATNFPYMKGQAAVSDNGSYRVIISSAFGSVTSSVCAVTVSPDLVRPVVFGVMSDAGLVQIAVEFSEPMDRNSSENISNYVLQPVSGGPSLVISNAVLSSNGLCVLLTTTPRIFKESYSLFVQNLRNVGCSSAQSLIYPNPTVLTVHSDAWCLLDWRAAWKYEDTTNLDNTGWQTMGYDDQAWYVGPGLFGFESQQPTLATFPAPIRTIWRISLDQPTYYARTLLKLPEIDWQEVLFQVRHVIDDGLVLHVNGAESFRVNMADTGPVTFTNLAVMNGDARLQTNYIALNAGTNVLAAEVHQATRTSGDIVFGVEVLAIFPPPVLSVRLHEGAIRLEWTPRTGTLEQSSDLVNWSSSAEQTNPQLRPPSAQPTFFRIRR